MGGVSHEMLTNTVVMLSDFAAFTTDHRAFVAFLGGGGLPAAAGVQLSVGADYTTTSALQEDCEMLITSLHRWVVQVWLVSIALK